MDNDSYIGFLALSSYSIIEILAQMLSISKLKALDIFYNSQFYKLYECENTKLWHFSSTTLAEIISIEVNKGFLEFPVEG